VDLATVSVAAGVGPDGALVAAMGAVGPRPLRSEVPGPVDLTDTAALDRALDQLVAVATPISDVRGSREYRLATLRVLTKRAVLAAADRRDPREMAS
jgi:carbon-monoxide dehydrogenase medium subunit